MAGDVSTRRFPAGIQHWDRQRDGDGQGYGMSLLWTIVASCLATFVLINAYGRYTLVTGETALQAIRKHMHPAVAIFIIAALTAGVCGSVMGVMGIVADISFE